jgi:hypothetical protein
VVTPGTCANRYSIARTYTATDACGNKSPQTQTITVNDVTPPEIKCPLPKEAIGTSTHVSQTGNATATDNCSAASAITITHTDGAVTCTNGISSFVRTFKAEDECGNSSTCPQTITVRRSFSDGCFTAELTGRVVSSEGNTTFTYKVCGNNCNDLSYLAFVTNKTNTVLSPSNGSWYNQGTNDYKVVTPVSSKQYGIKFEAISKTAMLKNGGCYTFVFTLKGDVAASGVTILFKAGTGAEKPATPSCTNSNTAGAFTSVIAEQTLEPAKLSVSAYPNPVTTGTVKFTILSPVSGKANLEVVNMLGQRIQNVFNGSVEAGVKKSVDFNVPKAFGGNFMYILRVGGKTVTGKLLQ